MNTQLALNLYLQDDATFNNFFVGDNHQAVMSLKSVRQEKSEKFNFIYGGHDIGKTHLLQACCHYLAENHQPSVYLPLINKHQFSPKILDDLETVSLICLDDIDAICGDDIWEEAIFHLYNRVHAGNSSLIISGSSAPNQLGLKLADLVSRLNAAVIFQIKPLSDEQKIAALQLRAKFKGLELSCEAASYLLNRYPRNMAALFTALEKLDQASMQAQRKLTIPFLKNSLKLF